jgi:hypothetical protein
MYTDSMYLETKVLFLTTSLLLISSSQHDVVHSQLKGRILGQNTDKSLKSFPPCYSYHLYSFALRFLFLQTHATS